MTFPKFCFIVQATFLIFVKVSCFWPPPYEVKLNQDETFVISDLLGSGDINDVYQEEEEMIKREELEKLDLHSNADKYYRIHQHTLNRDNKKSIIKEHNAGSVKKYPEFNADIQDPIGWKAGFVDQNEKFIDQDINEQKVIVSSNKLGNKEKRDEISGNIDDPNKKDENYDYSQLKNEYIETIKIEMISNNTLNYTDVKEEESVKDAVKTVADFKKLPRNCTEEEKNGIGLGALECFWIEIKQPKLANKKYWIFEKILRIVAIWLAVYLVIAIPLWCQKGWCCCCCRCKFCRPLEQIEEAKVFFAQNPLGVYHDIDGKKITYKPTNYENYAQKNLEHALLKL